MKRSLEERDRMGLDKPVYTCTLCIMRLYILLESCRLEQPVGGTRFKDCSCVTGPSDVNGCTEQ